jgi:hypothetical protein
MSFSTIKDNLVFTKDGQEETYKLPYPVTMLSNVPRFVKELNRRTSKLDLTADNITTNSHYVFIEAAKSFKVRFPDRKYQVVHVDEETHKLCKVGAMKAGLPSIGEYIKLCVIMSKSDIK